MKWRTRVIIYLQTELSSKPFNINSYIINVRNDLKNKSIPENYHIIDILTEDVENCDIKNAHILGIDSANIFIDRLSLITYSICTLYKIISTCPEKVKLNERFKLLTHDILIHSSCKKIEPEDISSIEDIDTSSHLNESIYHIRKSLSTDNIEQKLLHMFISLETIARQECTKINKECPNCSFIYTEHPATNNYIKELLKKNKVSNEKIKKIISSRGKVAHGGGKRNIEFIEKTKKLLATLQSTTLSHLARKLNIKIKNKHNILIGLPTTEHIAVKESMSSFLVQNSDFQVPAQFVAIDDDISISEDSKTMVGCPLKNDKHIIDPIAWPD